VYFYQLGIRMGLETLLAEGTRMGFNRKTGARHPGRGEVHLPAQRGRAAEAAGARGAVGDHELRHRAGRQLADGHQHGAVLRRDGGERHRGRPHLVDNEEDSYRQTIDLRLDTKGLEQIWPGCSW
jgi:penicillin-binding protein 2